MSFNFMAVVPIPSDFGNQENKMSQFLLFNRLSRFVRAFLPRSKCLLIL